MVPEVGRVPEYVVPLSKSEEERVEALLNKGMFIDLHEHPLVLPSDLNRYHDYLKTQKLTYGYEGIRHGRWTAVGAAVSVSREGRWSHLLGKVEIPWLFEDMIGELGFMLADFEKHRDVAIRVSTSEDVERAKEEGKIGLMPVLEHLAIGNVLDRIDLYYGFGVRMAGLTYTRQNFIGQGQAERYDSGLTDFGMAVVERMNQLGMIIDVSHTGSKTSLETMEYSKQPVVFSHTGSYTVHPCQVLRGDEEVKACAEKGGAIGVFAIPNQLSNKPKQGVSDVLNHIDYFVKLVGVDYVAVGTEAIFGDHVGVHRLALSKEGAGAGSGGASGFIIDELAAPYMEGIESPAEGFNIVRGLVSRGYSDSEIFKMMGGNAMRVFRSVLS